MARGPRILILAVALYAVASGCAGVKVSTDLAEEERLNISRQTAARIRAEWAREIQYASPAQHARLLHAMWRTVTSSYIDLGYETVAKWRYLESVEDAPVSEVEVKELLDGWVRTQKPVLSAYQDNIFHTISEIEMSNHFEKDFIETIRMLRTLYDKVWQVAFNPVGSPDDYEHRLELLEFETSRISDMVTRALSAQ